MPTYQTTAGDTVTYPEPVPAVAAFLARVLAAAADPAVSVNGMIELVYGRDNPLLDHTRVPGRSIVTPAVFDNPVFRVMSDQLGVKKYQLGLLDPERVDAAFTVTVAEAATELGLTPDAVRAALSSRRLAGHMRNGEWYLWPGSIAAYKLSNGDRKRGPKPARKAPAKKATGR